MDKLSLSLNLNVVSFNPAVQSIVITIKKLGFHLDHRIENYPHRTNIAHILKELQKYKQER